MRSIKLECNYYTIILVYLFIVYLFPLNLERTKVLCFHKMNNINLILIPLFAISSTNLVLKPKKYSKFSSSTQFNIVNGFETDERPFYVRIVTRWRRELICGGTIISHHFVLTAAKCFDNGLYYNQ